MATDKGVDVEIGSTGPFVRDICPTCAHPVSAQTAARLQAASDDHMRWIHSAARAALPLEARMAHVRLT